MSAYVAETPTGEAVAQRGGDAGSVARAEGCRQPCLPSLADSGLSYSVSTSARARSVVPVVRYPPAVDLAVSDPAQPCWGVSTVMVSNGFIIPFGKDAVRAK